MNCTRVSRLTATASVMAAFALAIALPTAVEAAPSGSQTFTSTGGNQTFTVPAAVNALIADLFGAPGGTTDVTNPPARANGGETTATLSTTPGQAIEVVVGAHGVGGTSNGAGAGGFNGGGDGSTDGDGCCPGGAGGGGASDVRTGACASTLTCDASARAIVAGGGGGAGGGADAGEPGGAGGGTTGADGTPVPATSTAGGGGTQSNPGAAGTGSSAGTVGDTPLVGDGGPGGGVGGGGGGGWHGGGGGASTDAPDGAGGGGGSSFAGSPSNLSQGTNTLNPDGIATFYWLTWSPSAPTPSQQVTLTSHVGAAASGGTETFTDGSTTLCSSVPVGLDGTAVCTATLALGSHAVTATYTDQPDPGQIQFNGLDEVSTVTVVPAPPPPTPSTPATGASPTTRMDTALGVGLSTGGLIFITVAAACRRRRAPECAAPDGRCGSAKWAARDHAGDG
jgi:hypothetical protein